jgi:hypothetical protein
MPPQQNASIFDGSVEDARERPIGLRSEILCISKLF